MMNNLRLKNRGAGLQLTTSCAELATSCAAHQQKKKHLSALQPIKVQYSRERSVLRGFFRYARALRELHDLLALHALPQPKQPIQPPVSCA